MPLELHKINKQKVGSFYFKELNGQYLLTNDIGEHCFLDPLNLDAFLAGKIEQTCPDKYSELQTKGFIRDRLDFDGLARRYAQENTFLGQGPSLHIVVVTLRCDHRCIYCQAGSQSLAARDLDMDIATAQKVVDRIFESPNKNITIEFQGGEPLVNWKTVKFIVEYAYKKNKDAKKDLMIAVVSNFTFINKQIIKFLIKNNIHICTSLDGPQVLHNKYRIHSGKKNSYKNTVIWLKRLRKEYEQASVSFKPSALVTITQDSLLYPKEIVDEYVNLDLEGIHLRPLSPFGAPLRIWKKISFTAGDFVAFYKHSLDYIIELNLKGRNFHERFATIFLTKILTERDPDYLDIRSPCGAGIGQLAYNFNGDVYTCDEGRMLSRWQDESFRLGNVSDNSYEDIINNQIVKTMCISSCLDSLPECSECVYKPYCGVCPLYNYTVNGNIFNKAIFLCRINKGILDYLFKKLQNEKDRDIFYRWVGS